MSKKTLIRVTELLRLPEFGIEVEHVARRKRRRLRTIVALVMAAPAGLVGEPRAFGG